MLLIDTLFDQVPPLPHPLGGVGSGSTRLFTTEDLDPAFTLFAYAVGVFPWGGYQRHAWWFTNPRFVLNPSYIHVGKQMRKLLREFRGEIQFDGAFVQVIDCCASAVRDGYHDTWISNDHKETFTLLHQQGWAHSVEVWEYGELVGGLYGLALGKVFYGESMFHKRSGASKIAFYYLCKMLSDKGFTCIDCQMETPLLRSFGGDFISGDDFFSMLKQNWFQPAGVGSWSGEVIH